MVREESKPLSPPSSRVLKASGVRTRTPLLANQASVRGAMSVVSAGEVRGCARVPALNAELC